MVAWLESLARQETMVHVLLQRQPVLTCCLVTNQGQEMSEILALPNLLHVSVHFCSATFLSAFTLSSLHHVPDSRNILHPTTRTQLHFFCWFLLSC